ncbi:hypothetical protein RJ639_041179 [Escallonia herrerae]|uniref:Uncharacterized protein n=1 Tax=Escallonia herrerae TaxID=1293975 RepID=A0AA88WHV0_9ASTE|nr:hypothetical protein RJ639_041179 [Escallonia herrerae]
MSHRVKEEERIERIIRGLLKLPENRRILLCLMLLLFSYSNLHRLRDFIKHVYVIRKYTGEQSCEKLPMVKVDPKEDLYERSSFEKPTHVAKEDFYERHSFERSSHGAKDDFYERRSFERSSPSARNDERSSRYVIDDRRSPRYKQENVRSGSQRNRRARFEIVDDRFRDDGFGSIKRSENHRFSKVESRAGSRSPDPQKIREMISPPVMRPVKDILGENVPALKVGKVSKANDRKDENDSAHAQVRLLICLFSCY